MLEHLLNPNVIAILVKGLPGAGKTTLALELLHMHGKGLYVSTRVSEEKLEQQYPHVKGLIEKGKLIEVAPEKGAKFEDLRFGRAVDIVESVLQAITKLKEPLIILDSWDAFAKELDLKERLRVEKSLVGMAEANKTKLVFISEEPHLTTTDYLADAIVTLKDEELEGRRIRRIEWNKLRGLPIPQKSYLFTLHEGRFRMFPTVLAIRPAEIKPKKFKPIRHTKTHYSLGSPDLNALLGLVERGTVALLEVGKGVSRKLYYPLSDSIVLNFLSQGGCALVIPSGTTSPYLVKDHVSEYLPKKRVEDGLRVGTYEGYEDPCFFRLGQSTDKNLEIVHKVVKSMKKGNPCVYFIGADTLEFVHGTEDMVKFALNLTRRVRYDKDLLIMMVKHSVKGIDRLSDLSDLHCKLDLVDGALISYIIKPAWQTIYNLDYDFSKGHPQVRLTPIV